MAEVDEIYNEIASEVAQQDTLIELDGSGDTATALANDVSNGSIVSRNRAIMWLVAFAMWVQQVRFRLFTVETQELALDGHYGSLRWLVAKIKQFQYGDDLVFTPLDAYYDPVVPANRPITHAAAVEVGYKVILKIAVSNGSGLSAPSSDVRTAAQDYIDELKPPIKIEVRGADGDRVSIYGKVITDAKQGTANIQANVELAINAYLKSLDENGVYSINKVRQAVLDVEGVVDFVITSSDIRRAGSSEWIPVTRVTYTYAGWAKIAQDAALSTTLEYVSSNV